MSAGNLYKTEDVYYMIKTESYLHVPANIQEIAGEREEDNQYIIMCKINGNDMKLKLNRKEYLDNIGAGCKKISFEASQISFAAKNKSKAFKNGWYQADNLYTRVSLNDDYMAFTEQNCGLEVEDFLAELAKTTKVQESLKEDKEFGFYTYYSDCKAVPKVGITTMNSLMKLMNHFETTGSYKSMEDLVKDRGYKRMK